MFACLIFIVLFNTPHVLLAQIQRKYNYHTQHTRFDKLSIEDGLSQGSVLAIVKDTTGFLWFATQDGINKYDGYEFTLYSYDPSKEENLPSNYINDLYLSKKGELWACTRGGFCRYDFNKDEFISYTDAELEHKEITTLTEDVEGNLWLASNGGGLYYFDIEEKSLQTYSMPLNASIYDPIKVRQDSLSMNIINSLIFKDENTLLVGGKTGLHEFNLSERRVVNTYTRGSNVGLESSQIKDLMIDHNNNLWVGTYGGGVTILNMKSLKYRNLSYIENETEFGLGSNLVHSLFEDANKNVWIATTGGLSLYNSKDNLTTTFISDPNNSNSLSSNRIWCIWQDELKTFWVGTDNGINILDHGKYKFQIYSNKGNQEAKFSSNIIRSIYKDSQGIIWIGTEDGGLNRLDRVNEELDVFKHEKSDRRSISGNTVNSIYEDEFGQIWMGLEDGGLSKYHRATNDFTQYIANPILETSLSSNRVVQIVGDRKGSLWITTEGGGLNKMNLKTETFTQYKHKPDDISTISSDFLTAILVDSKQRVWVGTYGKGINLIDLKRNIVTRYTNSFKDSTSISSNIIHSIFEDEEGYIWFGTYDGLNKMDVETEKFTNIQRFDYRHSHIINAILEDPKEKVFWLSSNQGLYKYFKETGEIFEYTIEDGLQSNQFYPRASFRSNDDEFFFGGLDGFCSFRPKDIIVNKVIPRVVLSKFFLFGKEVHPKDKFQVDSPLNQHIAKTKSIVLEPYQKEFSIEVAALNYRLPRNNKYAYKLENFNDWVKVSSDKRLINYTNLDPGEYTFMVKASNNDGIWNNTPTTLKITIIPYITDTWWFRVLIGVILIVLVVFLYLRRVAQIEKSKIALEELIDERTREIKDKNKELQETAHKLSEQKEKIERINDKLEVVNKEVVMEKNKSERLLLNILPKQTAEELKEKGKSTPRVYDRVSVMFTDFKGFTQAAEKLANQPIKLLSELDNIFLYFDKVVEKHNLEKIKTIGDSYMCAGGIPIANKNNPIDAVLSALEIQNFMDRLQYKKKENGEDYWELRLGIHTGPLIAGVVGKKKFAYDIWGDAVNLASRMESSGYPGKVNVSVHTYKYVKDLFECEYRGKIAAKNKGDVAMYFVNRIKPEYSFDEKGLTPNNKFREIYKKNDILVFA